MSQHTKAISRGIAYLLTVRPETLCIIDQALVVRAIGSVPGLDALRQHIITRLMNTVTDAWLTSASLADVFTVVNALHYHDPQLIKGDRLALLVRRLLQAEREPGGPYTDTQQLDPYTNTVINQFASWAAEPLPNVSAYLATAENDTKTNHHTAIHDDTRPTEATIKKYLLSQQKDGSWHHDAVCTALALQKIIAASQQSSNNNRKYDTLLNDTLFEATLQENTTLSPHLQAQLQTMLTKLKHANKNYEISLLSYYVDALLPKQAPHKAIQQLGTANIYGWLAYTLYDDMLDGDADATHVSLANIALRQSYTHYYQRAAPAQWQFVMQAFQTVDEANDWELTCARATVDGNRIHIKRLPRYTDGQQLAQRSYIHVLGPLLLAHQAGLLPEQIQALRSAFEHYLIARQLNDDIHDWKDDLQTGQLTYVVSNLLEHCEVQAGTHNLEQLTDTLQQRFRNEAVSKLCDVILSHTEKATQYFAEAGLVIRKTPLETLVQTIAHAAQETKRLQHDSLAFQTHFRFDD